MASEWLERGLVRLHQGRRGPAVGAGLLIGPDRVVTCAHVVAAALGRDNLQHSSVGRRAKLWISFPAASGEQRMPARIARGGWRRVDPETLQGDVAVLELAEPAPEGCGAPPLLCPAKLDGHEFVAKGFPFDLRRTQPQGVSAHGSILGTSGPGDEWRQLDDRGVLVRPGFSGAPVWDETARAVVGIVVARDHKWVKSRERRDEAAFMIPLSVLIDTWEPLGLAVGWRARFDPERDLHWDPRSRGTQGGDDAEGQLFTGRRKALGELAGWLADPHPDPGARIVTGRAGAGKSSVVARLVMGADPDEGVTLECDPPAPSLCPMAIAVVCREDGEGLDLKEVVRRIARWTDAEARTAEGLVDELRRKTESTGRVPTIVLDQLDEAARPHDLISLLLRPLAERGAARVLVGLAKEDDGVLPAAFGDSAQVLDLDADYLDEEDLKDYVEVLLRRGDAYAESPETNRVATEVATQASPLFLIARLVALYLADEDEVAGPRAGYPTSVDEAMRRYLERIARSESDDEPGRRRVERTMRDLMGALAYSRGPGLPLGDGAWRAVAEAMGGESYDDESIDRLRDSAARYLLQSERENGVTYYRLFHRALAGALARGEEDAAVHDRIVTALAALTPADTASPVSTYVQKHLSGHALVAGADAWKHLAERPETLDRLAPIPLRSDVARAALAGESLPPQLLGVLGSAHLMEQSAPGDRAGLRQLGMARVTDCRSFDETDASASPADWTVASAVLRRQAPHVTIPVDDGVRALTCVENRDGQPLLVGTCGDRSVRTWSASTGELVSEIILGTTELRALAACQAEDGPRVAVGDTGGLVHLFNPEAPGPISFPSYHRAPSGVRSLAAFVLHGKVYVAVGGDENWVRLWDDERKIRGALRVPGPVRALTARVTGDRVELAAGADDGRVTLWRLGPSDLTERGSASPVKELEGPIDWIRTVVLSGDGDDPDVVAGAEDGGVYLWPTGARSGSEGRRLNGRGAAVLSGVALPAADGGPAFATAGRDSEVTLWSADGTPDGEPLSGGRFGAVCGLAAYRLDGEMGLASADGGGVRIWTPPYREVSTEPEQARPVVAVAACPVDGETLAATGDDLGMIRLWRADGETEASIDLGRAAVARVLVPYPRPDAKLAIAIGGDDELVRFVDAATGDPIAGLPELRGHHGSVRAVCLGVEGIAFVTGGEDGTMRFWDAEHREIVDRTSRPGPPIRGLQALHHPRHKACLAVVGPGRGLEVRLATVPADVVGSFEMHTDWAMAVAVRCRPVAPLLVTAGDDGAIWVYDLDPKIQPRLIGRHDGPVRALSALGDGDSLVASGGDDGTVRLWDPASKLSAQGCLRIGGRINALCGFDQHLLIGTDEGHLIIDLGRG